MSEGNKRCKYCDGVLKHGTMCHYCAEKLRLVRKLQAMVRNAKYGKQSASK